MLNWDNDDDSCCRHCGCEMEVIGPPGPDHSPDCPSREPDPPPGRNLTDSEVEAFFANERRKRGR